MKSAVSRAVVSADGTPIAVRISGEGPALVLVHGTSSSGARWAPVLPILERHFTTHVVERRGRGESGDGPIYALAREVEDVAAVVDSIGGPVDLLGHSFGGLVSLEAALVAAGVRKLAVYEPAVAVRGAVYPTGALARFESLLAAGDREAVVVSFFRDVLGVDEDALARTRALPSWPGRVAAAHTIPREVRATDSYSWNAARFAALAIPVRLFVGGASHPLVRELMEVVAAALPGRDLVVLEGQKHVAMDTAPERFVRDVVSFFAPQRAARSAS